MMKNMLKNINNVLPNSTLGDLVAIEFDWLLAQLVNDAREWWLIWKDWNWLQDIREIVTSVTLHFDQISIKYIFFAFPNRFIFMFYSIVTILVNLV